MVITKSPDLLISNCIPSPKDTRVSAVPLRDGLGFVLRSLGLYGLTHCCFINRYHLGMPGWSEEPTGIRACGETFACKPQGEKSSSNSQ